MKIFKWHSSAHVACQCHLKSLKSSICTCSIHMFKCLHIYARRTHHVTCHINYILAINCIYMTKCSILFLKLQNKAEYMQWYWCITCHIYCVTYYRLYHIHWQKSRNNTVAHMSLIFSWCSNIVLLTFNWTESILLA